MKRSLISLALAAWLVGGSLATAAMAEVVDRAGVLSGAEITRLERSLEGLGPHRVDVYYERSVAGSPSQFARKQFDAEGLKSKDMVIVVGMGDRKIGVYVGSGFTARGVSDAVVAERIKRDFKPAAQDKDLDGAVLALSRGLIAEGARTAQRSSRTAGATAPARRSGPPFDWGGLLRNLMLVVLALVAAFAAWWYTDTRKGNKQRIVALRERFNPAFAEGLRLAETYPAGRKGFGEAYPKLADRSTKLLGELKGLGDRLELAEGTRNAWQAEDLLAPLEAQLDDLASDVAVLSTAFDRLVSGKGGAELGELPERADRVQARLGELKTDFQAEFERGKPHEVPKDAQVEGRLHEAERLIAAAPVDVDGAEKSLAEADKLLKAYRKRIEKVIAQRTEADKARAEADRARAAERAAAAGAGAIGGAAIVHHHHDHHSSSWSGGSSSWSSGSSSDDSWGSSDAGSSSDDSWSSSDSGSSSDDNW